MLVLSRDEVESLLDLDRLVDAVEAAMVDVSSGRVSMPARIAALVAERQGLLAAMPAYLGSAGALTAKLVSLFPQNRDRPTHHALICCFDPTDGSPLAVMDGSHVTAVRTAAGSVVATRLLARPDATVVAVIGTGVQAKAHLQAFARLPGVQMLRVAGRDAGKAADLAREALAGSGRVEAASTIEAAVRSADIVCAVTHAARPVVLREWLRPGTHVNAVGYNPAGEGEVDAATVRDALVVVESREAALAPPPSGAVEIHRAIAEGVIAGHPDLAEIGELVTGRRPGRTHHAQITLYKSVGIAAQDAAAAALVLDAARRRGIGTSLDL